MRATTTGDDGGHGCAAGRCASCSFASTDPDAPSGWRLVIGSAVVFFLPLVTAIAAAALWHEDRAHQTLAAVGGLAVGIAAARMGRRFFSK